MSRSLDCNKLIQHYNHQCSQYMDIFIIKLPHTLLKLLPLCPKILKNIELFTVHIVFVFSKHNINESFSL